MSKQSPLFVLAAVAVPLLALFGPAMRNDRMFAMRDAGHYYLPLFQWCSEEWKAGRVPLWNPQENCGTNVLADATSSLFYPGKLVFALPLDFLLKFKLYIVGHVVLAAAACYWLARRWGRSSLASGMAAVAYAFGGTVAFQHANVVFLVGAAWLPVGLGAVDGLLKRPSLGSFAGLSIVLALMVLGGDPQAAYHLMLIAGLYCLLLAFKGREATHETRKDTDKEHSVSKHPCFIRVPSVANFLIIRLALLAASGGLAAGLAAVQIIPSAEATRESQRAAYDQPRNVYEAIGSLANEQSAAQPTNIGEGIFAQPPPGSHHQAAYEFSVGPWRLAEFIWPNVGGRMYPMHCRWFSLIPAEGRIWSPSLYVGLLPLVLGISAWRLRSGPLQVRWLSWLLLIFMLGSFGWYGLGWLVHELYAAASGDSTALGIGQPVGGVYWLMVVALPQYVYFRYPAKLLVVAALALCQLAAIGWDDVWLAPSGKIRRVLLVLGIASGIAGVISWLLWPSLPLQGFAPDATFGPFDHAGARLDVTLAFLHTAVVALAAWCLFSRDRTRTASSQAMLLLLIAVEIAIANYWLVPSAPVDIWRSESAIASTIKAPAAADGRIFRANHWRWRPARFAEKSSANRVAEIVRWEHETLFPKHHLPADVSLVQTYGSLKSSDYDAFLAVAAAHGPKQSDGSRLPHPTALRALGTEWLVLPSTDEPAFATLHADGGHLSEDTALWRMNQTLPRAWIVHEFEQLPPLLSNADRAQIEERTRRVLFPSGKPRNFSRSAVIESAVNFDQPSSTIRDSKPQNKAHEACRITHSDPQHIVIEATLQRPGLLVLADAFAPGWKARTRRTLPVLRTNRVMQGVFLNAGQHRIEFRYRPKSFRWGATISIISSLLLLTALALLTIRRARKSVSKSSNSAPA